MAEYIPAQLTQGTTYDAYPWGGNSYEKVAGKLGLNPKTVDPADLQKAIENVIGEQPAAKTEVVKRIIPKPKVLADASKKVTIPIELPKDTVELSETAKLSPSTRLEMAKITGRKPMSYYLEQGKLKAQLEPKPTFESIMGDAKGLADDAAEQAGKSKVIPEPTAGTSRITLDNLPCKAREAAGKAWNFLAKPLSETPFGRILPTESQNACVQSAAKGIGRIPILLPIVAFATKLGNIYNGFKDGPVEGTRVTAKSAVEATGITAGAMAGTVLGAAIIGRVPFLKNLATRAIPIMGREFSITAKGVGAFLAGAYLAVKGDWIGNRIGRAVFGKSKAEEQREMPRVNCSPLRPSLARDMDLYTPRIRRDLTYDEVHDFIMNPQQ